MSEQSPDRFDIEEQIDPDAVEVMKRASKTMNDFEEDLDETDSRIEQGFYSAEALEYEWENGDDESRKILLEGVESILSDSRNDNIKGRAAYEDFFIKHKKGEL